MDSRTEAVNWFTPAYTTATFAAVVALMSKGYNYYQKSQINKKMHEVTIKNAVSEYEDWKEIFRGKKLPAVAIDLDAFDNNLTKLCNVVRESNKKNIDKKTVRLATKSIRVPTLIIRALKNGGDIMQGVMCYCAEEAQFLNSLGIDDILIAYPTIQKSELKILREMHTSGTKIVLVLDSIKQIKIVAETMQDLEKPFPVVIELDTSIRFWQGFIHLGARRSPVHTLEDLRQILQDAKQFPAVKIIGVMAYESAVSGLADNNPDKSYIMNSAAWLVRRLSATHTATVRAQVPKIFAQENLSLEIFNGGGTGSIDFTANEDSGLTEISFGSGLLNPHLFGNNYSNLQKLNLNPAIYFAIPVSRISDHGKYVTCFKGGDSASGPIGVDRLPKVIAPKGIQPVADEGHGEVQTPFKVTGNITPELGDPIVFIPAKAGEFVSKFNNCFSFFGKTAFVAPHTQIINMQEYKKQINDSDECERIDRKIAEIEKKYAGKTCKKILDQTTSEFEIEKLKTYKGYGRNF